MKNNGTDIYRIYIDRSLFVYGYINSITDKYSYFSITTHESQLDELLEHLEGLEMQICFDSLQTEYQLLDDIISTRRLYLELTPSQQLEMMCRKMMSIVKKDVPIITEKDYYIPQVDLSKLLGLNTSIRTTRISDVAEQFNISFPKEYNEIPESFGKQFFSSKFNNTQVNDYIEKSTLVIRELLKYSYKKLDIVSARKAISSCFGLKTTLNMSNIKAGEVFACRLYCKKEGIALKDFPKPSVKLCDKTLSDIVKDNSCHFHNDDFNEYSKYLSGLKMKCDTTISYSFIFDKIILKFGNGGMHGCVEPGVYKSDKSGVLMSFDISSFYASIIVMKKYYPSHLKESFVSVVEDMLKQRISLIDNGLDSDKPKIDVLKEMLVGIYGKFKEQQSNLYDSTFQLKITVASQLFMLKWIDCMTRFSGIEFLSINTDGFIVRVPEEHVDKIDRLTNGISLRLNMHIKSYKIDKIYIKNVNNYMCILKSGEIVKVGCFDDSVNIYRTPRSRKIASAINDYFIYNVDNEKMKRKYDSSVIKDAFKIIYSITEQQQSLF